jgi:hypothetical protein
MAKLFLILAAIAGAISQTVALPNVLQSGFRRTCGTKDIDPAIAPQVEADVQAYIDSQRTVANDFSPFVAKNVPVWFHVIRNTNGAGSLTPTQIRNQITVLNQGFAGQYTFTLVNVSIT